MYTLIGIIWLALSIIIATQWYNKAEKNIIRMGSPIKRLIFSAWDWVLYLIVSAILVAVVLGILLGILNVWGWIIGLVCIAGIVIWMLVKRKH